MSFRVTLSVICTLFATQITSFAAEFDVLITNGRIVDGTGAPWYRADIGIRDAKIAAIGRLRDSTADHTLDASGLIVAPGFIDMMGQTATPLMRDENAAFNLLSQGITTINCGEGVSAAPVASGDVERTGWQTLGEYFLLLEQNGLTVNVVQTVGHTQVRRLVLGDVDRHPSPAELDKMRGLVRQAMEDGAIGLSTALIYPPAVYASTDEISSLAAVAGEYGGRYYTHMRNEGDQLLFAIDEALMIGEEAKTPVHIFHLKAAGQQNWAKIDQAIAKIRAARAAGQHVAADIYPYINNGLGIAAFIHPRHFAEGRERLLRQLTDPDLRTTIRKEMESEGGWENWFRHTGNNWDKVVLGQITAADYSQYAGKSLGEIARLTDKDPWDVFFEIARFGAFALPQSMSDANKIRLMQQNFVSFCTDVGPAGGSRIASHPRAFGSFPRMLSRYVRDLGAISLERAVSQASALAANEVMAYDRGRISIGLAADLIVFNFDEIQDKATFEKPQAPAVGIRTVLVNGQIVFADGKITRARPGRVLRGPGWKPERRPAAVSTGKTDPRLKSFDDLMQSFLDEHAIAGASLAVTDQGRLTYARGFGYADVAAREAATATHLYRIASISKQITAVAILQLVDQKKLTLDDPVFQILDNYEPHLKPDTKPDKRQQEITIRHLLHHTGGWDRNVSYDAMFQSVRFAQALDVPPPAGPDHVIRYMLGEPLDVAPGERYAYSNYGYCLLGRVIEDITGQPYEAYVRKHVLAPLGITSMRIGRTRLSDRMNNEVRYYAPSQGKSVFASDLGQTVSWPYGAWYLEAMDSHGAWLASAVDLARFAAAFDDPDRCPILSADSVRAMWSRPKGAPGHNEDGSAKPTHYGLGWMVRTLDEGRINVWHTGSLSGTAALLVRRHDGRNWAVLFNTRSSGGMSHAGRAIDGLLHQAADAVQEWPAHDLFQTGADLPGAAASSK